MFSRLRFLGRAGPLNVAGGLPDSRGVGNSGVPNSLGRSRQIGLCSGHFCRSDDRMALPLVHFCGVATRMKFCDPPIHPPFPTTWVVCTCAMPAGAGRADDRIRMPPRQVCKLGFASAVLHPLQSDDLGKGSGLE